MNIKNIIYGSLVITSSAFASNPEISDPEISVQLTDTNTSAEGERTSDGLLLMVNSGNREATVTVALTTGKFCEGYPKWSGIDAADGSLTANYSGTDAKSISITAGPGGATTSASIAIFPELDSGTSWNFDDPKLKKIQDGLNAAIKKIAGKDTEIEGSGSIGYEAKVVDFYNDGSKLGGLLGLNGSVTITFPDIEFESPKIPVPTLPAISLAIGGSFTSSSLVFDAKTDYDQSKENPGTISGSLTGSTTAGVKGIVSGGKILTITLTGSTNLVASGSLALVNKKVDLTGTIKASDFNVGIKAELETWIGDYALYEDDHEFEFSINETITTTLHEFKD